MSTAAAIYMLIIMSGTQQHPITVEIRTRAAMTLEQCYKAGAEWQRLGPNHWYECKRIKP